MHDNTSRILLHVRSKPAILINDCMVNYCAGYCIDEIKYMEIMFCGNIMISGIYRMTRQSDRIRARCDEPQENGDVPPPVPTNWQEVFVAMEARLHEQEEELREFRRQATNPTPHLFSHHPLASSY